MKDAENDLKLKSNQKPKPSEPETSIHLKPFAAKEQEPNIKPDAEEMMPAPVPEELEKGKKTETAPRIGLKKPEVDKKEEPVDFKDAQKSVEQKKEEPAKLKRPSAKTPKKPGEFFSITARSRKQMSSTFWCNSLNLHSSYREIPTD